MAKDENKKVKKENKNEFKNLKAELKKVVWPTPKQLANNTIAVITIVLITAVIVFGLDFIFEKINEHGIEKLKSSVGTKNEKNNSEENATAQDNGNTAEENSENAGEETNAEEQTSETPAENTNSEEQTTNNEVVE